jgi:PAS domain S-box-containing protein
VRLEDLLAAVPVVVYEAEPGRHGAWLYVSPHLQELLGYSPEEWTSDPRAYVRCLHPDDRDAVLRIESRELEVASDRAVTAVSEYRMIHRDGRVVWVRDEARLGGHPEQPTWCGALIDIGAERASGEALEQYRSLLEGLSICLYRSAPGVEGRWSFLSPQIADLVGYGPAELASDPSLRLSLVHPDDLDRVLAEEAEALDAAPGTQSVREYRLRHRSGTVVRVRDRAMVVHGRDGATRLDGMMGLVGVEEAASPPAARLPDVYRLTCPRCGTAWAATRSEQCPECGNGEVEALSLEATLRDLGAVKSQVEGLLDGIHQHLDALRTSIGAPSNDEAGPRRVLTPLSDPEPS